jgi:DNA-binding SARP family transcriptional activator
MDAPNQALDTLVVTGDADFVLACVRVLGPLELVGSEGMALLGGAKERRLLAVLAVHSGEVVADARLVDALWDGDPPRTASKTLQNYVLRLRRALRGCAGYAIVTRPPGYRLDGATDADQAEGLIAKARRAAEVGEYRAAINVFDQALALWRGQSLAEFVELSFAESEAVRLDELRASATEDRMAAVLALGRHHEAIAELETMVADKPLRERRWTQLMLALYRDGRQADALVAYRRLGALLGEQLGVDPGLEVQQLEAAILAHDASLLSAGGTVAVRTGLGLGTPCLGRDREIALLLAHLDEAVAGRGRVVLLAGEAGIGKTRLLGELDGLAEARGARVLSGRCVEGAGTLPFQPFAEAVDTYFEEGGELPTAESAAALAVLVPRWVRPQAAAPDILLRPDEVRMRLLDGVVRFLVEIAGRAPVVLLLDDLHWGDAGTVALLRHAARGTRARRVLLVGAYRDGELTANRALDDALGVLRSEADCSIVRLRGIARAAVDELLCAMSGSPMTAELVEAIYAETGGNPFFTREILRHLQEDGLLRSGADGTMRTELPLTIIPEGVRQVIARRRRRLLADTNNLLDAAAGIDGPFPLGPVRSVAGLSDSAALAAVDDALDAGLIVASARPDQYDFTHALIRHAVYQGLNPSRRLRLHRDLAGALARARARGAWVMAAEIAVQYHRAGDLPGTEAGVEPALEAAEHARAAGAHDEHAEYLRIALDLLPPQDGRKPRIVTERAVALAWSMRFDEAVEVARAVADMPDEEPVASAAAVAEVATVLAAAGSNRHAWLLAPIGLRKTAGPHGPDPASWAALTLLDLDRQEAADPEHPGMPLDLPGRRTALTVLHESGRLVGRGDLGRYALAAIYGRRDRIPPAAALDPTVAAFLLGDYAAAGPRFEQAADTAKAHGQLAWEVYCRSGAARCQVSLGEVAAAQHTVERCRELISRLPDLQPSWQMVHYQGTEDAVALVLDEGWPERLAVIALLLEPNPERHWGICCISAIGARIHARMGEADPALPLLSRPVRALRQAPAWAPNYARVAYEVSETLWLLDRRDHLSVVETALREKILPTDFRFPMTDARLALARLCALTGRYSEARKWFDAARKALDAQAARPLRAVVDHDEALMFLRIGDRSSASPLINTAMAAFDQLGMTGWTRRLASAAS